MPELPEVETVCRSLRQTVLQQTIESVTVRLPVCCSRTSPIRSAESWKAIGFVLYGGGANISSWICLTERPW